MRGLVAVFSALIAFSAEGASGASELLLQASAARARGELPKAVRILEACVKAAPDNQPCQRELALTTSALAKGERKSPWFERARTARARVVELALGKEKLTSEGLADRANTHRRAKEFEFALGYLERCLAVDPSALRCHRLLGTCWAQIASRDSNPAAMERAREAYERYLELAPPEETKPQLGDRPHTH